MTASTQLRGSTPFKIIKTLQSNHRYKVSEIEQDGEIRILKQCNDPALEHMLQHDVQSSFYLETVRSYNIESVFRVRKIYSYGDNWYIAEKFSGQILYDKPVTNTKRSKKLAEDLYAPFLYEINLYTPQVMLGKNVYIDAHGKPNSKHAHALEKYDEWASVAMEGKFITREAAAKIRKFVAEHLVEVKYGLELHDLEPWEIFVLPTYKIGVIDLEYLNLRGRRHFDTAYNFQRLWFDCKSPKVAKTMLERYVEICGEEQMDGAFLSLFGLKLMGYLRDAATWMKDTVEKGKPVVYSHEEADELVRRYLHFSIDKLAGR